MTLIIGENNQIAEASEELATKAKLYFAKQYLKANADSLLDIFNAVKAVVDSKPIYVQVQTRRYSIMALAFGWPAVQDTSSNAGKARYLESIQSLIAIYS